MQPQVDETWKHYGTGACVDIIYSGPRVQMKDGGTRWVEAVVYQEYDHDGQHVRVRSLLSFLKSFEKVVE